MLKHTSLALIALALAACAGSGRHAEMSPPGQSAQASSAAILQAADQSMSNQDIAGAISALNLLHGRRLSANDLAHYQFLRGQIAVDQGDYTAAIALLPANPQNNQYGAAMLMLRARALFATNQPVAATQALVRRERFLSGADALSANRAAIWAGLTLATGRLGVNAQNALSSVDNTTAGWVKLAQLSRSHAGLKALEQWRQEFPHHPGASYLMRLMMPNNNAQTAQGSVYSAPPAGSGPAVLLLPTSGPFAQAAAAVQKGFAAEATVIDPSDASAQTVDENVGGYQQALNDDPGLIIGPLTKQGVANVASVGSPSVPVLALNYLDEGVQAPPGLYQFGLAPADDARQDAENAISMGLHRAVALVPDNDRGQAVLAAFKKQLEAMGGVLVASATYAENTNNVQPQVQQLLDINASIARDQALDQALRQNPKFTPRMRDDIDFIFIFARPTEARMIWPMFRFYGAYNLPIYATSVVASDGPNPDLVGIRYCGAPWLLEPDPSWAALRQNILNANAGDSGLAGLYAMGMDTARLANALRQGKLAPNQPPIAGATGLLSVQPDGVIRRTLACNQLTADSTQTLDAAPLPLPSQ